MPKSLYAVRRSAQAAGFRIRRLPTPIKKSYGDSLENTSDNVQTHVLKGSTVLLLLLLLPLLLSPRGTVGTPPGHTRSLWDGGGGLVAG